MNKKSFFSKEELERISATITSAEEKTCGEIVPVMVEKSSSYDDAGWKIGALAVGLLLIFNFVLDFFGWLIFSLPLFLVFLEASVLFAVGFFVGKVSVIKRAVTSPARMERRVWARAYEMFVKNNLHTTKDHTGILIFASVFERMVIVLADTGVAAVQGDDAWNSVVHSIVSGIKKGTPGDGFVQGIQQCGDILAKYFPLQEDSADTNELADRIIEDHDEKGGDEK